MLLTVLAVLPAIMATRFELWVHPATAPDPGATRVGRQGEGKGTRFATPPIAGGASVEKQPFELLSAAGTTGTAVRTLAEAQRRLQAALKGQPRLQATVHLLPGVHVVPAGGLRLGPRDSPGRGGLVQWLGGGLAVISGGANLTGWRPVAAEDEPGLPPGVWAAAEPAGLPAGFVGRHMTVDGVRAPRTRKYAEGLQVEMSITTMHRTALSYWHDTTVLPPPREPGRWPSPPRRESSPFPSAPAVS